MKTNVMVFVCALLSINASNAYSADIRYVNFKVYDPIYIAIDKGFFEKQGVSVEVLGDTLAGPTAIQAVSSGSAEAGLSSIPALINANIAGLPVQGVADIQTTFKGQSLQQWYVKKDSPINSIRDVIGKRFAVNLLKSSFYYTALIAAKAENIRQEEIDFKLLSFDKQIIAFQQGDVDVIGLMQPYQSFLEQTQGSSIRVLFNDYTVLGGERQVSLIFINRVWAKAYPEKARKFVRGIVDAISWIEQNQAEAKEIISKYTNIPSSAITDYHFTKNGEVRIADVSWWMLQMQQLEEIQKMWITPEMIATNDYQ